MTREQFINEKQNAGEEIIDVPVLTTKQMIFSFFENHERLQKRFFEIKTECQSEIDSIKSDISTLYNEKKEAFAVDSEQELIEAILKEADNNIIVNLLSAAIMTNLETGVDIEEEMINLCNKELFVTIYQEAVSTLMKGLLAKSITDFIIDNVPKEIFGGLSS